MFVPPMNIYSRYSESLLYRSHHYNNYKMMCLAWMTVIILYSSCASISIRPPRTAIPSILVDPHFGHFLWLISHLLFNYTKTHLKNISVVAPTLRSRHGFRNSFISLTGMLFTFPSRYSFTIDLWRYLALEVSAPRFRQGFSGPALLEDICIRAFLFRVQDFHFLWSVFPEPFC